MPVNVSSTPVWQTMMLMRHGFASTILVSLLQRKFLIAQLTVDSVQKLRITEEERAQAGLNTAQYPDGSGDYISSLDVAHQIHCLDEVRKATNPEYYKPMVNDKLQKDHIAHCINYIRQILMCRADVTLLEYHDVESAGLGSERQRTTFDSPHMCADYGKIYDWAWNKRIKVRRISLFPGIQTETNRNLSSPKKGYWCTIRTRTILQRGL